METRALSVGSLLLDPINPRHEPVRAQDEAIAAIIEEQGQKLVALMANISERGLSPIDRMLVIVDGRRYIVVEGNRRIAAIKLLNNPDLAHGSAISGQVKRVARTRVVEVTKIDCAIAAGRGEARPWILLRHDGESDGAGTVRWRARQAARFNARPGSQSAKALAFLEAVDAGYPDDEPLRELADEVGSERITTLGRLVADPGFRDFADFVEQDGTLLFRHDATAMKPLIERLLRDIATDYNVTKLKLKSQRQEYMRINLPKLDSASRHDEPRPLGEHTPEEPRPDSKPTPRPRTRAVRPEKLFKGLELENLGSRIPLVLREVQRLSPEDYPNAAAILTRVLLELSVDHVTAEKGWHREGKFKNRLRKALHEVDKTDKDPRFQSLRVGLQDDTSLYAVGTMHSYVHNPHVHPSATEARTGAANIAAFLQKLDTLA